MNDWNGNDKRDSFDDFTDYELYRRTMEDNGAGQGSSCLGPILMALLVIVGSVLSV